jgi:hypothetical protein
MLLRQAQGRPLRDPQGWPSDSTRRVGVLAHHLSSISYRRWASTPTLLSGSGSLGYVRTKQNVPFNVPRGTFWDIFGHFGTYKTTHSCYAPLVALQKRRSGAKMSHIGGVVWDIWDIACTQGTRPKREKSGGAPAVRPGPGRGRPGSWRGETANSPGDCLQFGLSV